MVKLEERERVAASHQPRSRRIYLMQWIRVIPNPPQDPSVRYTLLCVDSHRRVQTLFDPNETETWLVQVDGESEPKTMTRRDVVRQMLPEYRADERVVEEEEAPGKVESNCPWDAYLCLLTRALALRFGTDVLRTGWVARRILRNQPERFGELEMRRWVAHLADMSRPEELLRAYSVDLPALKVALGLGGGITTCPALWPSGQPCGWPPQRDGYCSLHLFTLPSA